MRYREYREYPSTMRYPCEYHPKDASTVRSMRTRVPCALCALVSTLSTMSTMRFQSTMNTQSTVHTAIMVRMLCTESTPVPCIP
jgi:hypothetical protein